MNGSLFGKGVAGGVVGVHRWRYCGAGVGSEETRIGCGFPRRTKAYECGHVPQAFAKYPISHSTYKHHIAPFIIRRLTRCPTPSRRSYGSSRVWMFMLSEISEVRLLGSCCSPRRARPTSPFDQPLGLVRATPLAGPARDPDWRLLFPYPHPVGPVGPAGRSRAPSRPTGYGRGNMVFLFCVRDGVLCKG